jgi:purine nucleosidase
MALKHLEVIAITTVMGNTAVDNVDRNVREILRVSGSGSIPVFTGAPAPLLGGKFGGEDYHGKYGLLGYWDRKPAPPAVPSSDQSAVEAIINLTKEHSRVSLICLGPLTNLALALKLDSSLPSRLG